MLDIAAYDRMEREAMIETGDWATISLMSPAFFSSQGFPVRVETLAELRFVMDAMSRADSGPMLQEMRGLREDDLEAIADAVRLFLKVHNLVAGPRRARIPVGQLLYAYLVYRKLKAFPRHSTILEIGPGEGYVSFFLCQDTEFTHYASVEVTQSLYALQTAVNAISFGDTVRNAAYQAADYEPLKLKPSDSTRDVEQLMINPPATYRAVQYPWWKADQALDRTYDVIMSNENMCEMPSEAFDYYVARATGALSENGVFMIHGIGKTLGPEVLDDRLSILKRHGFRAYIQEGHFLAGGLAHTPNLVLVREGNPLARNSSEINTKRAYQQNDPVLRAYYGLNRPDGRIKTHSEFVAAVRDRISRTPVAS